MLARRRAFAAIAVASVVGSVLVLSPVAPASATTTISTVRASVDSSEVEGNSYSRKPDISADGTRVVFLSDASNLDASPDTNGTSDVFVRDLTAGTTQRVSVASDGAQADSFSDDAAISADGNVVAFVSWATNLVAGDTNARPDVFVHDLTTGVTQRVSVANDGSQGAGGGDAVDISGTGRYVAFASTSDGLVAGDASGGRDVFVRDRQSNTTTMASVATGGAHGNSVSFAPAISADGNTVAFVSLATNLVSPATTNQQTFVHDMTANTTELISQTSGEVVLSAASFSPSVSGDGNRVAFYTSATGLGPTDTNGDFDVYVRDRTLGTTDLASRTASGNAGNGMSAFPAISDDGRAVSFTSEATDLGGDASTDRDVFLYDRYSGLVQLIDITSTGEDAYGGSGSYGRNTVSSDGRYVAYESSSADITPPDTNGQPDVFVADRGVQPPPPPTEIVVNTTSDSDDGACDAAHCSLREAIAAANTAPGPDPISFAITGSAPHTIHLGSMLPPITGAVVLDATTNPDFTSCTAGPVVELDGSALSGLQRDGLDVQAAGSTIRGFVINGLSYPGRGVYIEPGADGTTVQCNWLGTDATGTARVTNNVGLVIASTLNTIGGTTADDRNVISGSEIVNVRVDGNDNRIEGNYIGTDAAGTTGLGAGLGPNSIGVFVNGRTGTVISGNVISGNDAQGIWISGTENVVSGNVVGLGADGSTAVPNASHGVVISSSSIDNRIGGTASGEGNTISGNAADGVYLSDSGSGARGNAIEGNRIGVASDGVTLRGNGGDGIELHGIEFGARNTTIGGSGAGAGNVIAGNVGNGITASDDVGVSAGSTGNRISANSIHDNGGLAIDLGDDGVDPNDAGDVDSGPNRRLNHPLVTNLTTVGGATQVDGTLAAEPSTDYRVELFVNGACDGSGSGEAGTFSAAVDVTTDGSGAATFSTSLGTTVTSEGVTAAAIATVSGDTSELSPCLTTGSLDPDGDGLTNDQEAAAGTDPLDADSDDDGLSDGAEVNTWFTDPLDVDSDHDGLSDGAEVNTWFTDPLDVDSDHDGLNDGDELIAGTDPNNWDTDGDGTSDGDEIAAGTDPLVPGVVVKAPVTLTLTVTPQVAVEGTTVTYHVAVGEDAPGSPTGNVVFTNGWQTVIATAPIINGVAEYRTSTLTPGWYYVQALYGGNGAFQGASSAWAWHTLFAAADQLVAVDDAITTAASAVIPVLANDRPYPQWMWISSYTQPAHGSVTCNSARWDWWTDVYVPAGCSYTANPGYLSTGTSTDDFTYTVTYGQQTATATVRVTVHDNAPDAVDDHLFVFKDTGSWLDLLRNDVDRDLSDWMTITGTSAPTSGTVSGCASWCYFTPAPGFTGDVTFTYTVADRHGLTDTATATITVSDNQPPVAVNDTLAVRGWGAVALSPLLGNDSDPDSGDWLQMTSVTPASHGQARCDVSYGWASCVYAATPGFTGTDSFDYTATDTHGATATATVTVTVTANAPPVAVDDVVSLHIPSAGTTTQYLWYLTSNDTDPEGDYRFIIGCTGGSNGTVAYYYGACTYTPAAGYSGPDTLSYTIDDGHGGQDVGDVALTVLANHAPVAVADAVTTISDQLLYVSAAQNDTDADRDWLRVTSCGAAANGTVTQYYDWYCRYQPNLGFVGTDSFSYTTSDSFAGTATGTVTVTVVANQAPTAADDTLTVTSGVWSYVSSLANDTDPNSAQNDWLSVVSTTPAAHGTASCWWGCQYRSDPGYAGADSFTYTIRDRAGLTSTATVTVNVVADRAPIAQADAVSVTAGGFVRFPVLDNDSDPDSGSPGYDWFWLTGSTQPAHGFAECSWWCLYVPETGFTGTDTFTYTLTDIAGMTSTGTVTVTVSAASSLAATSSVRTASARTAAAAPVSPPPASYRASLATNGREPHAASTDPAVSDDGRYVAFASDASDLVPGDTNGARDIFVRDAVANTTERVSVDGLLGNADGSSLDPSISDDGRYVAFTSLATNIAGVDGNGAGDVFVYDRTTKTSTLVSQAAGGGAGNGSSGLDGAVISGNGRFIAFTSDATDLVAGDTNGARDVFVFDRTTGSTARVSVPSPLTEANGASATPSISDDGRLVAFSSSASNLVAGDTNHVSDVFVHDRQSGLTTRESVAGDGSQATRPSVRPSLSGNGSVVAFVSSALELGSDGSGVNQVFRRDRSTGAISRASSSPAGGPGLANSDHPVLSDDGRYVAFDSSAANLASTDTNNATDVFVYDARRGQAWRVSVAPNGAEATGTLDPSSSRPALDANAAHVVFQSDAPNILPGDGNGVTDVYALAGLAGRPRQLGVGDVTIREGDSGTRDAVFTVTLSEKSTQTVTVALTTESRSATAGADFTAVSQTITFAAGVVSQQVAVPIRPDTTNDGTEAFAVVLRSPTNATIGDGEGIGTIVGDDPPSATPVLSVTDHTVHEGNDGNQTVTFTVALSKPASGKVKVDYRSIDGTAVAGSDYTALALKTLTIAKGATSVKVTVKVTGDRVAEANETFNLQLSNAVGATIIKATGTVTILDDD